MIFAIDIRHLASPNPSGVGRYTLELVREMARVSPKDAFILFASGRERALACLPHFSETNIRVVARRIPNRLLTVLLRIPFGPTLDTFLREPVDAWLFPNVNHIRTRRPYAVTMHDISFALYPEFFTRKTLLWHRFARIRRLLTGARAVLTVSRRTAEDIADEYKIDSSKITVAPLGVDDVFTSKEQPEDRNFLQTYGILKPYILTLSTLEPRKNIASAIEAYSAWREQTRSADAPQFIIAGGTGWKVRGIDDAIARSPFKNDIVRIGYVEERHKSALYRHANTLLFPSFYEGFGLPVLEAMASGTPVITSFTSALPELTHDAAILIDPYNVTDIERALAELEDHDLYEQLIRRGIERSKLYTWRKTARKTLTTLYAMCGKIGA